MPWIGFPTQNCNKHEDELEREYNRDLYPQTTFVERLRDRCGDRWPEAMFMDPCLVTDEERERVWTAMRVSATHSWWQVAQKVHCIGMGWSSVWLAHVQDNWTFWRRVKKMYEDPGHELLHPGAGMLHPLRRPTPSWQSHGNLPASSPTQGDPKELLVSVTGEKAPWRHRLGLPLPDDVGFFTGNWMRR